MVPAEIQKTIRQTREKKGWDAAKLAKHVCLSVRQIKQLEGEPGDSFYSDQIRLMAAKKVLCRMGLEPNQVDMLLASKSESAVAH